MRPISGPTDLAVTGLLVLGPNATSRPVAAGVAAACVAPSFAANSIVRTSPITKVSG